MPNPTLAESVREHLQEHGPCTDLELHAAMVRAGRTAARTPASVRAALQSSSLTLQRPDGLWDVVTRRLVGAVLTVRPRAVLRDHTLWVHADLEPFTALGSRLPLTSGGVAELGGREVRTLTGPPGWLPEAEPGQLLALRWDGRAMTVNVAVETASAERVRHVRSLLRLHSVAAFPTPYGRAVPTRASVVLSALLEDPQLLADPLPPLSELLPFDEELSPDTGVWESHSAGRRLTVHLPERVYDELHRRSDQLGDRLPDYAGMLLGAAADRLSPRAYDCPCRSSRDAYSTWQDEASWHTEPLPREEAFPREEANAEVLRLRWNSS